MKKYILNKFYLNTIFYKLRLIFIPLLTLFIII